MSDPNNNDAWRALKSLAHALGRQIWKDRIFKDDLRPIGLWYWVFKTLEAIRKHPHWSYDIPPADTVKRRINYLTKDGLWTCTYPEQYFDMNPETGRSDLMSAYLPSPLQFPDEAAQIGEALRRGRFTKMHGRQQVQLL